MEQGRLFSCLIGNGTLRLENGGSWVVGGGGILLKANPLEMFQLYFRVLMVELNENLEKEEVNSLGFLLRDYTPRMKMAKDKVMSFCWSSLEQ